MNACIMQSFVDAHFAGTIRPENETKLRAHLPACDACHRRYRRRLVLASLDPAALPGEERIARGLGFSPRDVERPAREGRVGRGAVVASIVLAIAATILLFVLSRPKDDGFASRGAPDTVPASHVQVYRARPGAPPVLVSDAVRRDDELAFAYENGGRKEHLMIFGVDEHGHVFWYHPAWNDPAEDPGAVRVATDADRHELREGVAHALDGERLEVHALFLERRMTVKEVERLLAGRRAPVGALAIDGAIDHVVKLSVTP